MIEVPDHRSTIRAWIRRGAVVLGVGAVLTAVFLVAFGGLLPDAVRGPIAALAETLGQSAVAWSLALAGTGYALWRVVRGRRRGALAPDLVSDPPETTPGDPPRTGNRFEAIVADHAAVADPTADDDRIQSALADVVVDVESRATDRTEAEIRARIRTGEWTDDRIAAAFLGADAAPGFPLRARIHGWLSPPRAYERRVERTVDAIHDLAFQDRRDSGRVVADDGVAPTIAAPAGTTPPTGEDVRGEDALDTGSDGGDRSTGGPDRTDRDRAAASQEVSR